MKSINLVLFVAVIFSLGCISPGYAQNDFMLPDTTKTYRFNPGDGLRLMIYEDDLNTPQNRFITNFHDREYALDGEGYVRLGPIGTVKLSGMTVEEATEKIQQVLQPYARKPKILLFPLIRISMVGEFGESGMYRFDPSISLWDVVAEAGGVGSSIRMEDIYILRNGVIIYKNFRDAIYSGTSLREIGIQSGDEIVAPRVNRLSLYDVFRYVNFASTMLLLYYTIQERTN